jgi:hypothetical protein
MFTSLKGGNFANATLMFQRGAEDVRGRVASLAVCVIGFVESVSIAQPRGWCSVVTGEPPGFA